MVLEHIFPEDWLENKGRYAFILGVVYSIIAVIISTILFPGDPALVAVAFTSMLLLPEMYKIFSIEERQEAVEQKVSMRSLWRDDIEVVRIYIFLFLGILLVYSVGTMLLPSVQTNSLFREQLEIRFGQGFSGNAIAGQATSSSAAATSFSGDLFFDLLSNNFMVLVACFILALLTGDGAIFLITWNASVWGAIFGITAKNAALFAGKNPFALFGVIMLVVFPHMILEAISYFLAAIAGSVISKDVLLEEFASERFLEVFGFNLYLLLFGLIFLVLGALVETFVLDNVPLYQEIIRMSLQALAV
ncbi:MAG: stage II sporulation protein M [Nanoarchaeota archaeon]